MSFESSSFAGTYVLPNFWTSNRFSTSAGKSFSHNSSLAFNMYVSPTTARTWPVVKSRTYTPSFASNGIAFRCSKTVTESSGIYSIGPLTIHLSPALRSLLASVSLNDSVACNNNASSSDNTWTCSIPFSNDSPGNKKKLASPLIIFFVPSFCTLSTYGSKTTQNCLFVNVVIATTPSTFSYTSGIWESLSLIVTSHSSPAFLSFP